MTEKLSHGGTLRLAIAETPAGFDPVQSPHAPARWVMDLVYSTLTRLDVDGNRGPGLAEHMTEAPDGRSYTFRLRREVRFHDDAPLSADDVVFSLDRVRARGRDYAYWAWMEPIRAATVLDPLTVRLELSRVCAALPTWLAFAGAAIVSRRAVEGGHDLVISPLGIGSFRWGPEGRPDVVRLEAGSGMDGRSAPALAAIELHVVPDPELCATLLTSGEVEFADAVTHADWEVLKGSRYLIGISGVPHRDVQELLMTECPRIATVFPMALSAHSDQLQGYVPLRNGQLETLARTWLSELNASVRAESLWTAGAPALNPDAMFTKRSNVPPLHLWLPFCGIDIAQPRRALSRTGSAGVPPAVSCVRL